MGWDHWLDGIIELASPNQHSLAVSVEEGVPVPFALGPGNRQYLLLSYTDGRYVELTAERYWEVQHSGQTLPHRE